MEWDKIESNWDQYKPLAQEKWRRIPSAVLDGVRGSRDRLIDVIQQYYDVSREQARREVNYWTVDAPRQMRAREAENETRRQRERLAPPRHTRAMHEVRERIQERGGWAVERASDQIQSHPVATLMVAVGLGMLIGQLARRAG